MRKIYWIAAFVSISIFSGCSSKSPVSIDTPYGVYYNEDYIQEQHELYKAKHENVKPKTVVKTKVVYKTKWKTRYSGKECNECIDTPIVDKHLSLGHPIKKKELNNGQYTVLYTKDFKKLEKVYDNIYDDNDYLRSR